MSVSPEDLGRGLYTPGHDDALLGDVLPARLPASRARRKGARTSTVAAVTAGVLSLAAAAAAATGALPTGKVGEVLSGAGGAVTDAVSRQRPTPTPRPTTTPRPATTAPSAPGESVAALLDATEAHLDAGRVQPASATLTAALRRLERLPVAQRDAGEVARYGALRARLLAVLEGGAGSGRPDARPTARAASAAPRTGERATPSPRRTPDGGTARKAADQASDQPSKDASAKPRA